MPSGFDCFDTFLLRVGHLISTMYRSLEFACVAAKRDGRWILVSGKALLSTEACLPNAMISDVVALPALIAISGRIASNAINNLAMTLRNSWVADTPALERIWLPDSGGAAFNWTGPEIFTVNGGGWPRAFSVIGTGPNLSGLVPSEVDTQLRLLRIPYNGFDGLCGKLGLQARRSDLTSNFRISALLPARFVNVEADLVGRRLEIDVECVGSPDLMIEWLPQHSFETLPPAWQPDSDKDGHRISSRSGTG